MAEEETSNDLTDIQDQDESVNDVPEDVENVEDQDDVELSNSGLDELATEGIEQNAESELEAQDCVSLLENNDTDALAESALSTENPDPSQQGASHTTEDTEAALLESNVGSAETASDGASATLLTVTSTEEKSAKSKATAPPAKESSAAGKPSSAEGGDESFVVQLDDTMLNDIDADLLDGGHGEGKASESATTTAGDTSASAEGETEESKAEDAATSEQATNGPSSTAETKDGSKAPASKEEKDTKSTAKRFVKCH